MKNKILHMIKPLIIKNCTWETEQLHADIEDKPYILNSLKPVSISIEVDYIADEFHNQLKFLP